MGAPLNDFVRILRAILKVAKYGGLAFLVVTIFMIGRELWALSGVFAAIWEPLRYVFLAAAAGVAAWLLGPPVARFVRVPRAVTPPKLPGKDEPWAAADVSARAAFLGAYLDSMGRNGMLREAWPAVVAAKGDLLRLPRPADPAAARETLARFERERLEPLLAPLDRQADSLIRKEALAVGVATALSPNGALDAFLVLWRNANLVSRLANVYYGRPGIRGSLRILGDVGSAALLATYAQGISEAVGGVLKGVFGSVVGVVAGPVLDGTVNAAATHRIGTLAKARCRSFKAWNEATKLEKAKEAFLSAAASTKDLFFEIAKAAGHGLASLPGKVVDGVKGGVSSIFRFFRGEGGSEPGPAEG
ncbi:MAG: YcjF family protein [Planctomycetes bacterium]|nr:YcjF family protein [Planctomycetota bacterium]